MLNSPNEYAKMAEVEEELWWYQILHQRVKSAVSGLGKDASILDVACGTGGVLQMLAANGFVNAKGIDISEYAIKECQHRGLDARIGDMRDIVSVTSAQHFDVILCLDAIYFIEKGERQEIYRTFTQMLKPGGILVMNVPVFACFRGMHDLSVGLRDRIEPREFFEDLRGLPIRVENQVFWPFLLSPIVLLTRTIQRVRLGFSTAAKIDSDIDLPNPLINRILLAISSFERKVFPRSPFGSSLFVTMRKQNEEQSTHA